jgi:hypothetical protein
MLNGNFLLDVDKEYPGKVGGVLPHNAFNVAVVVLT